MLRIPKRDAVSWIRVDVQLRQRDLALPLGDGALEDRRQHLARPAPVGPEVDDHRELLGALDHLALEGLVRDVHAMQGSH